MSQEILNNFDFEGKQVRTVMNDNEPWFVLNDVCKVLEISNPRNVKDRLTSDDPVSVRTMDAQNSRGQTRKTAWVNESGLYDVIFMSRKPQAKDFRRWVTNEVLPSIRKHGVYMTEEVRQEALVSPDFLREIAQTLEDEQRAREALEREKEENAPKVEFAENVEASSETITMTELAKLIDSVVGDMNVRKLSQILREEGYLYKRQINGVTLPKKEAVDKGLFKVKETGYWSNVQSEFIPTVQTRVTGKGQTYFLAKFLNGEVKVC